MAAPSKLRVLGVLAGVFLIARDANANSPAPFSRPTGVMPGVLLERPSPVVVEREDLEIDCTDNGRRHHPRCRFVATYHLFNPTAEGEELLGAFSIAIARVASTLEPDVPDRHLSGREFVALARGRRVSHAALVLITLAVRRAAASAS